MHNSDRLGGAAYRETRLSSLSGRNLGEHITPAGGIEVFTGQNPSCSCIPEVESNTPVSIAKPHRHASRFTATICEGQFWHVRNRSFDREPRSRPRRGWSSNRSKSSGTTVSRHDLDALESVSRLAEIGPGSVGPRTGGRTVPGPVVTSDNATPLDPSDMGGGPNR